MNILVIGSGGREHALCRTFAKSGRVRKIFSAPGNAGIEQIAECVPIKAENIEMLARFALDSNIDLTFVGGEVPLALGIVDEFEKRGLKIIGASMAAAQLEASKALAKDFMARHEIPSAKFATAKSTAEAIGLLEKNIFGDKDSPVVVKADGLAAGKGVVVASDRGEAIAAINDLKTLVSTSAASAIVLEECLIGREVSLIMFADSEDFALMPPTRDHKRIGEGDTGPNTGGMGTITDESLLSTEELQRIVATMIRPTLNGCVREGFPFRGILFLGLMMTADGPKLLEYNVRFGDPEAQSILVRLETDLVDICSALIDGDLANLAIKWTQGSSATIILASEGYPGKPRTGDVVHGIEEASNMKRVEIFHAGTTRNEGGDLVTAGGRVLGVTATADDLASAVSLAYTGVGKISWNGMQYRRDIGTNASVAGAAQR